MDIPCSRSGEVTPEMLDAPDKRLFILIGALEAASQLLGFIGASQLPGEAADHLRHFGLCRQDLKNTHIIHVSLCI